MSDEYDDFIARADQGPAERLIGSLRRTGDRHAARRLIEPPSAGDRRSTSRRGLFTGALRFTFRIWRVNLLPLLVVGALATAAGLLVAVPTEGLHSAYAFSGTSLVVLSTRPPHLLMSLPIVVTGLVSIAAFGWASATMVAMLIDHVRKRRPASLRDLGCGLPFWGWVTAIYLLQILLDSGASVVEHVSPALYALGSLGSFIVTTLFLTAFVFYSQAIVDERRDGFSALGASWLLVFRDAGFWRVLGYQLLFDFCLAPILVAGVALSLHFGAHSIRGGVSLQLLTGLVFEPLAVAFVTVLYMLARGRREQIEAVLGMAGRDAEAKTAGRRRE